MSLELGVSISGVLGGEGDQSFEEEGRMNTFGFLPLRTQPRRSGKSLSFRVRQNSNYSLNPVGCVSPDKVRKPRLEFFGVLFSVCCCLPGKGG